MDTEDEFDQEYAEYLDEYFTNDQVETQLNSTDSCSSSNIIQKRKSYTLKFKLKVISQYNPHDKSKSFLKIARKNNVSLTNIKRWYEQKDKLYETQRNNEKSVREGRRLKGGGRKEEYPELESKLSEWINTCNIKGFAVKDKYLINESKRIANDLSIKNEIYKDFKGTDGWLQNFKKRNNFVSRRVTSTRILPDDARQKAINFISSVQKIIDEHKITPNNILNMDQVPRFYEQEAKSTITKKGSRNVLIKKASSSHKKVTTTFLISSDGKLVHTHVLFSKLKKVPSDLPKEKGFSADVNQTGMWSVEMLEKFLQNVVYKRKESSLLQQPILLILDSFGPHLKIAESKKYERYKIFMAVVPPSMTNILQPLDVSVNKSFHAFYNNKHNEYIKDSTLNSVNLTNRGNTKVPSHKLVSQWIIDWGKSVSSDLISNSFSLCGIGSIENYDEESLHTPLKNLIKCEDDIYTYNNSFL